MSFHSLCSILFIWFPHNVAGGRAGGTLLKGQIAGARESGDIYERSEKA